MQASVWSRFIKNKNIHFPFEYWTPSNQPHFLRKAERMSETFSLYSKCLSHIVAENGHVT
jgi:hypothetical protein